MFVDRGCGFSSNFTDGTTALRPAPAAWAAYRDRLAKFV
jgi:hypothetical protein